MDYITVNLTKKIAIDILFFILIYAKKIEHIPKILVMGLYLYFLGPIEI
jgi:hypothetical protein